jgi:hypothetical protein
MCRRSGSWATSLVVVSFATSASGSWRSVISSTTCHGAVAAQRARVALRPRSHQPGATLRVVFEDGRVLTAWIAYDIALVDPPIAAAVA